MDAKVKFQIISESKTNGVTHTCKKYGISRTLYYRWLNRYKSQGMDGLKNITKDFTPKNKTSKEIEKKILTLISTYPTYGPKAIKYLLEEIDCFISESAIYNVMKRHQLTKRVLRQRFAHKKVKKMTELLPSFKTLKSGECWLFWITDYGQYNDVTIYEYTLFDCISRIGITRFYEDVSTSNFEDLLTAVAMPVAQTLKVEAKFMCFFDDNRLIKELKSKFDNEILEQISRSDFNVKLHILKHNHEWLAFDELKKAYTDGCLTHLLPLLQSNITLSEMKIKFQKYIRDYNILIKQSYDEGEFSPIEYHNKMANTHMILPLWAYIDREY